MATRECLAFAVVCLMSAPAYAASISYSQVTASINTGFADSEPTFTDCSTGGQACFTMRLDGLPFESATGSASVGSGGFLIRLAAFAEGHSPLGPTDPRGQVGVAVGAEFAAGLTGAYDSYCDPLHPNPLGLDCYRVVQKFSYHGEWTPDPEYFPQFSAIVNINLQPSNPNSGGQSFVFFDDGSSSWSYVTLTRGPLAARFGVDMSLRDGVGDLNSTLGYDVELADGVTLRLGDFTYDPNSTVPPPVPEPSVLMLLAAAAVGVAARRHRRERPGADVTT